jgi:murein DD-endopeptidase MepM/ murein hydrolase activator NlpD
MFIDRVNPAALGQDERKLNRAVEGLFWEMVTRELLKSNPLLGDDLSGQIFGELFSQALAEQAAGSLELGLGRQLLGTLPEKPVFPVAGKITSPYGMRSDPFTGEQRFHHGLDVAAPEGEPIFSANGGRVVFAGELGNLGSAVVVQGDDGARIIYGHLGRLEVSAGQRIEAGQKLAEVGNTGRSTGPHLHLQVELQGQTINPLDYLKGRLRGIKSLAETTILPMDEK